MLAFITRYWWTVALRGLFAVLFGLSAFLWPGLTLAVLVFIFGVYALLDGLSTLFMAVRARKVYEGWWAFLINGLMGIGVGIVALAWPGITALAMLLMIAFWAVATGFVEMILAVYLRKELKGEWLLMLSGALSVIVGVWLVASPAEGLLAMVWLIGTYALFLGVLLVGLGFRLRTMNKAIQGAGDRHTQASGLGTPDTFAHG